jgi:hypothetical protein
MPNTDFIEDDSAFARKDFPDALDSTDVDWMIISWDIRHEPNKCSDCGGNYSLKARQFNELPVGATRAEAIELLRSHVRNRRQANATNQRPSSPRRKTLFLCKVVKVVNITDDNRDLLTDTEVDR